MDLLVVIRMSRLFVFLLLFMIVFMLIFAFIFITFRVFDNSDFCVSEISPLCFRHFSHSFFFFCAVLGIVPSACDLRLPLRCHSPWISRGFWPLLMDLKRSLVTLLLLHRRRGPRRMLRHLHRGILPLAATVRNAAGE